MSCKRPALGFNNLKEYTHLNQVEMIIMIIFCKVHANVEC